MNDLRWRHFTMIAALCLLALCFIACSDSRQASTASKQGASAANGESIHIIMSNVAENFSSIYQKIGRGANLSAQDQQAIAEDIANLRKYFKRADEIFEHKTDAYQIGYAFVTRYLKLSADLLKQGDQDALRTHLYALREICSTCHTQDKNLRSLYQGAQSTQFKSLFQYAEFNYSTRNYETAVKYYELDLQRNKNLTEIDIIQPLQRILSVYLQVYDDPDKALQIIRKYQTLKAHTDLTRDELKGWIGGLTYLKARKKSLKQPLDKEQLTQLVREFFGAVRNINLSSQSNAREEVQRLWLRGRLYEFLNSNPPRQQVPELLYWLSVVDQSTSYNYYFSYADLYLSQCVRKYADLPYAKYCFSEYEKYIYDTYLKEARLRDPMARYPEDIEEEYQELKEIMSKTKISQNKINQSLSSK